MEFRSRAGDRIHCWRHCLSKDTSREGKGIGEFLLWPDPDDA